MNIDRMAVNAAIEQLLGGTDQWQEQARIIVHNCHEIPRKGVVAFQYSRNSTSNEGPVTGHSPGHGDISVHNKPKTEHKEYSFGVARERVGYYKIWKENAGELGITPWWKADLTTQGPNDSNLTEYFLGYDEKTLEPEYFGIARERPIIEWPINLSRVYLETMHGRTDRINRGWMHRS